MLFCTFDYLFVNKPISKKSWNPNLDKHRMNRNTTEFNQLINKVINLSFIAVSFLAIPLNLVIFFALKNSEQQFVRLIPPVFALLVILLAVFRNSIIVRIKIWIFISYFFLVGLFCLLLGLIDVAGLWFLLVIVFVILVVPRNQAFTVLVITIGISSISSLILITGNFPVPFRYDFYNCQLFCILTRLLHYIVISMILYYIVSSINTYLKSTIISLGKEMEEKKALQKQVLEAVIQTEEKERRRIAGDLHDGLGPVFSTAKLYFQAYSDAKDDHSKKEIKEKLEKTFDKAIGSISEISHNISLHELINHGLIPALNSFLSHIEAYGKIRINFKHDNIRRFGQTAEITLYRAINELVNNTLKHSNASEISLQIITKNNNLKITYSDNGDGFDPATVLEKSTGMGMRNIQNRVQSLNGTIDIKSLPDKGIAVEIEIPYLSEK